MLLNPTPFSNPPFFWQLTSFSAQQVTATDGDKDRPQNIVYFLTGQGIDPDNPANSKFDINRTNGEIFVLKVIIYVLGFILFYFFLSLIACGTFTVINYSVLYKIAINLN